MYLNRNADNIYPIWWKSMVAIRAGVFWSAVLACWNSWQNIEEKKKTED
jgi:hypothetical protein